MAISTVCHMLIGPPGSGKTTLACHLQRLISRSCLIATDQIRQQLYGDPTVQGLWPQIEAVVEHQAREAIHQGQTIIYDATNAKRVWRVALLQRLAHLQAVWVGWHLTTPLATCLEWNSRRPRFVNPVVIEALHQALSQFPPQVTEGFIALYSLNPCRGLDSVEDCLYQLARCHPQILDP